MARQTPKPGANQHAEEVADDRSPSTIDPSIRSELQDTVIGSTTSQDQDASGDSPLPVAFGRYRVLRLLGRGGMGSVYMGQDEELDRTVAIKVPHAQCFATDKGRAAFLQEARTLARLEHPRIIPVYDAGQTEEGACFVIFKYVNGQTLSECLKDRRFSHAEISGIVAEVANGLHYAHKHGFVHRDIKPSNILIDQEDHAWVADFGLAVAESTQWRFAGEVSGTPAYMSPEQTLGAAHYLDGRTDIWSLGVVLYLLLTGRRPFVGEDVNTLFAEINQKEPRPPRMIDETIPLELERIVMTCLRKDVTERYTSAHDLARDLQSWDQKRSPTLVRNAVALGGVAVLTLVAIIALLGFTRRSSDDGPRDTPEMKSVALSQDSRLKQLIADSQGMRIDLGETSPDGATTSDSLLAKRSSATQIDLPPGEWAPIPLPGGFSDFDEKLRIARDTGDEDVEEKLLLNATNKLINAGHFAIAEHLAYRMVELAGNDESDVPFAYGQLGLAQYRLGKFAAAISSYQRSGEIYEKLYERMMSLPDSEQVLKYRSHLARLWGITFMRIGNVHKVANDDQLARIHYEKAKQLYEAHDRHEELSTLLLNYGSLEARDGNYDRSIELLQQGLTIAQESSDDEAELRVNLGNAYSRRGDNKLALNQYERAYELITADSSYTMRSALLGNYATTLLEEGRNDEALPLLQELKSFARASDANSQRVLEFLPVLEDEFALSETGGLTEENISN